MKKRIEKITKIKKIKINYQRKKELIIPQFQKKRKIRIKIIYYSKNKRKNN
jgi:hypothetical protein